MQELEATSWLFGALVAMLTLLSSVWYTASTVSNRNRDFGHMKGELIAISKTLADLTGTLSDREGRLEEVERTLKESLHERVKLLYVNTDHILLESSEGTVIKIPMVK